MAEITFSPTMAHKTFYSYETGFILKANKIISFADQQCEYVSI